MKTIKCNIVDCYWNLWHPNIFSSERAKKCVSEDLERHYDKEDVFKMTPNSKNCKGYLSYRCFVGDEKKKQIHSDKKHSVTKGGTA